VGIICVAVVAHSASGHAFAVRNAGTQRDTITVALAIATFDSAWLRIRELHYDSLMGGLNWNGVRAALRPRAERARTNAELRLVLDTLLATLGGSHYKLIPREAVAAFAPDSGGSYTSMPGDPGIDVRLVGDRAFVSAVKQGSSAYSAGVRAGWEVLSVGDVSVQEGVALLSPLDAFRTRRDARLRLVLRLLAAARGAAGTEVSMRVADPTGGRRDLVLRRDATRGALVRYGNLPPMVARASWQRLSASRESSCTGIIRFNSWLPAVSQQIDAAVDSLRGCAGIIVDLRGNTGGVLSMVVGVAGHFLQARDTLGGMRTRHTQLTLISNPRMSTASGARVQPFSGRMAVLVDELTGSTSEVFASSLQALGRARIFGDTTAGQAQPATLQRLPNGDVLMIVVAEYRGPRGELIEGAGVLPDVVVARSRQDLLAGRDRVLDSALRWASGQQAPSSTDGNGAPG
jgi:carboxyl-terminal processing protease